MTSFSLALVAGSDDSDEHGEKHFGFEGEKVGELLEEEEDDSGETKGEGEGEGGGRRVGGGVWWRGEETDEKGTEMCSEDEEKLGMLEERRVSLLGGAKWARRSDSQSALQVQSR